jgi:predicted nucleic acid-binding protein
MSKVVVDSNIVYAALRVRNSTLRDYLEKSENEYISPKFLFVEIFRHKDRLVSKAKISEEEIYEILSFIIEKIQFVSEEAISLRSFVEAFKLVKDVDLKDIAFVALSIEMDCKIWTKDEELKSGLRNRGFDNFFEV